MPKLLGNLMMYATIRLKQLERWFRTLPILKSLLVAFMKYYEMQNHMELVSAHDENYDWDYLPHGVLSYSRTSKLLVVLSASINANNLYTHILIGHKTQPDVGQEQVTCASGRFHGWHQSNVPSNPDHASRL